MATVDHLILHVNELDANIDFCVTVLGFTFEKKKMTGPIQPFA